MKTPLDAMMDKDDGEDMPDAPESSPDMPADPKHGMAEDIIEAVKDGDAESLASALHAFFTHCDMGPHAEGPHVAPKLHDMMGLAKE